MDVLPAYWPDECLVPLDAIRGIRFPKTEITNGWKPLCGDWELNQGPLKIIQCS